MDQTILKQFTKMLGFCNIVQPYIMAGEGLRGIVAELHYCERRRYVAVTLDGMDTNSRRMFLAVSRLF